MIIVDVILVAVLLVALIVGLQRGLVASLGVLAGLVAGAFAAFWLVPVVSGIWPWPQWRTVALIGLVVVLLVAGASLGGAIGSAVRRGVDRIKLRGLDRVLGGAISVVATALVLLLVSSSVAVSGAPVLSAALASSRVLDVIEDLTPDPVDATLAQLRSAVLEEGIPRLGGLFEGEASPQAEPITLDEPGLTQAAASVARVSGVAYACGQSQTGTGFVIAPDRVVTNAHVLAGIETPVVELPGREAREGTIVHFDPVTDLAVIAVPDLGAPALPLSAELEIGTAGAVQGYPFGGPFTSINAEVVASGIVPVPDIYSDSTNPRDVYSLAAAVQPGNSGGPLLTSGGQVAGVVFARGDTDAGKGYAMTNAELAPVVAAATGWTSAVPTGRCIT
ncbi:MarP family serine protease [Microbacterium sp. P02]|uniref:MarP family serine protease n=1 Tax=Microbacterium sp. P02 TaxID=3366260 RepID=UPI0036731746